MYVQYPYATGPDFVVSHGNSPHSKHSFTPLLNAQVQMAQNLFSRATHPAAPFGQFPAVILGHFSHAIPQTPTRIVTSLVRISRECRT
jgi:hypothetical protein